MNPSDAEATVLSLLYCGSPGNYVAYPHGAWVIYDLHCGVRVRASPISGGFIGNPHSLSSLFLGLLAAAEDASLYTPGTYTAFHLKTGANAVAAVVTDSYAVIGVLRRQSLSMYRLWVTPMYANIDIEEEEALIEALLSGRTPTRARLMNPSYGYFTRAQIPTLPLEECTLHIGYTEPLDWAADAMEAIGVLNRCVDSHAYPGVRVCGFVRRRSGLAYIVVSDLSTLRCASVVLVEK